MENKKQLEHTIGSDYYLYEKIGKMESDIEHLQKSMDRMYILMGLGFAVLATLISVFKFL